MHLPGYVSEDTDIESWGGGRVGRISRKEAHGNDCICALVNSTHNRSVFGRTLLLISSLSTLF